MELRIEHLTKKYGEKIALNDFSAVLNEGIYAILGPNGSGKSTLMNCITDNVKRTSGKILFNDVEVLELGKNFRSKIGYMPQQQGFYENFTVHRFLYYIAGLKGLKKKEAEKQIIEMLQVVNLENEIYKKVSSLSGGMRQRMLMAAALIGNPEIIILDEPTVGLDPEERINTRNFITKLGQGRIVILSTHVVSDIECIADKVLMMKEGVLIKEATPHELINSIKEKVYEKNCTMEDIEELQKKYRAGNIFQRNEGMVFRVVSDEKPDGNEEHSCFRNITENIGIDDVYMYYLNRGRNN